MGLPFNLQFQMGTNMLNRQMGFISKPLVTLSILFSFIGLSCKENLVQNAEPKYLSEIEQWHAKRIGNLKKENGWLNLVGLFWLKEGENKFGSANDNDIVFPDNAPAHIGFFMLKDSIVTINVLQGVKVMSDSLQVTQTEIKNDLSGSPTILSLGSFRWLIIKRGEKFGVRLRNLEAPLVKEFEGIERFPVNKNWRIAADFKSYDPPKKISVPNILGEVEEEISPGQLLFKIQNKEYSLEPVDSGDKLFIIFADETNGESTYGAGRFLYTDKPNSTGKVILDFNKAYNPPCAFTKYATCPLPPQQNHIASKITAGEKNFGKH